MIREKRGHKNRRGSQNRSAKTGKGTKGSRKKAEKKKTKWWQTHEKTGKNINKAAIEANTRSYFLRAI